MTTAFYAAFLVLSHAAAQEPATQASPMPAAPTQTALQPGPVLTMDEALKIAEANAFDVKISESQYRQSKGRLNEIRGLTGPKLTTSASYTRFDEASGSGGSSSGGGGQIDSKNASVQLTMPLDLTGILGKGVAGASAGVKASAADLAASKNTLRLDVRSSYYDVLRAQALVSVAQQEVQNAQQAVTTEEQREAAGVSAHIDVLRLQTQLAQAQSDVISAQTGLAIAKENLNNTLGRPIETPFDVQDPSALPTVTSDENTLTQNALARRPEIQSIRYTRKELAWIRRAQEGGLMPSLNLSATYNRNLDPGPSARDHSASATIGLSWPIFDSGVTHARVSQAREDERQAEIRQQQLELGISLEVRQAVTNLVNAQAALGVAQTQVTVAAETYRLAQVRLQAGEGTSLEVTNAQTDLTRAQQGLANARYNYLTAYAQLQRAVAADDPDAAPTEQGKETK